MATIYGNNQNNKIKGSTGSDYLYGLGGNDTVLGGAGDDFIYDQATYYGSDDIYNGGAGNDWLWSNKGNDTLIGGAGNDSFVLHYSGGDVILKGGKGHDTAYIFTDHEIGPHNNIHLIGIEEVLIY